MITYSVTLKPLPTTSLTSIISLLKSIGSLTGKLPGLIQVDIVPYDFINKQLSYSYTMVFDSEQHLNTFNTHHSYQPISQEIHRISPTVIVSGVSIKKVK